jgi:flagellin-specific chaperone FliS
MKKTNVVAITLFLLLGLVGCDNEASQEEISSEKLCLYLDSEDMSKAMSIINEFLAGLPNNKGQGFAEDERNLHRFAEWLKSSTCIIDAKVLCISCIYTLPAISEVEFSFRENGVVKNVVLDIVMSYPLQAGICSIQKEDEDDCECNDTIDGEDLSSQLYSGNMDKAMLIINEFLAGLPQSENEELYSQNMRTFIDWLNAEPCILHAYKGLVLLSLPGIQEVGFIFKTKKTIKWVELYIPLVYPWKAYISPPQQVVSVSVDCEIGKRLIQANRRYYFFENGKLIHAHPQRITVKLKSGEQIGKEFEVINSDELGFITLAVPNGVNFLDYFCRLQRTGKFEIVRLNYWKLEE